MSGVSQKYAAKMEITFLGQMGFRVQYGGTVIYIDPFLSDHPKRQFAPPMTTEQLCDADFIFGTHDHKDHIDRDAWPQYARISPQAIFVVPELLLEQGLAKDLKIPSHRFRGLTHNQSVLEGDLRITAIASAHEFLDVDPVSGKNPYLGYIIELGGYTLYHAGDTCRYDGLERSLQNWDLDVMILPINGRDAKRYSAGCLGNMTYQEAVDLAGAVCPKLVIPAHYDLFAHNGENPTLFVDYLRVKYPQQNIHVCTVGETYTVDL